MSKGQITEFLFPLCFSGLLTCDSVLKYKQLSEVLCAQSEFKCSYLSSTLIFSFFLQLTKDTAPIASVDESLLASISEIIESVSCIEIERENFAEIGCYFYR